MPKKTKKRTQQYEKQKTTDQPTSQQQIKEEFNPMLQSAIFETIDNQVRGNDPPETRQTMQRLQAAGYSSLDAKKLIGSALLEEIWEMKKEQKPFNQQRFAALLAALK